MVSSINRYQIGIIDTSGIMVSRYQTLYIGFDTVIPIPNPDGRIPAGFAMQILPPPLEAGRRTGWQTTLHAAQCPQDQDHQDQNGIIQSCDPEPRGELNPTGAEKTFPLMAYPAGIRFMGSKWGQNTFCPPLKRDPAGQDILALSFCAGQL
jgi:hypothetical protein